QAAEKAPLGPAADLLRDLEMAAAIVNRARRRLAGAVSLELDRQPCAAAQRQIERIQNELHRIGERIIPEKDPHVESSTTHHDSGTEHEGGEQTRDRAGAEDLAGGSPPSPAIEIHRGAGTAPGGEGRTL